MSGSILNTKSTRRIGHATGLGDAIIRAWSHGGHTHAFVTRDHHHGWFNTKNSEWGIDTDPSHHSSCYSSCRELFPAGGATGGDAL